MDGNIVNIGTRGGDRVAVTHRTQVALEQPIPEVVDAGAEITLNVLVTCPSRCDLQGGSVQIVGADGVLVTREVGSGDAEGNRPGAFGVRAPKHVGDHTWRVLFFPPKATTEIHEHGELTLSFRTVPHKTSLAVWSVPSVVSIGSVFTVKIGARCWASCPLTGHSIEVLDEGRGTVGEGRIGDTPWVETTGLYWTEVQLTAPEVTGVCARTVRFSGTGSALPHDDAEATFTFRADPPPEHIVTAIVVDRNTQLAVADVEVQCGFATATTGADGTAILAVPKGSHELTIRADAHQTPPMIVEVDRDMAVRVEALKAPTRAELEERLMKFEDYPWG